MVSISYNDAYITMAKLLLLIILVPLYLILSSKKLYVTVILYGISRPVN